MAVNVRQGFLHHTENGQFQIMRQAPQPIRYMQVNVNIASLSKSFRIPTNTCCKAHFVQQRRMQQVRNRPNFFTQLSNQLRIVRNDLG
jgi:hypothetical protein